MTQDQRHTCWVCAPLAAVVEDLLWVFKGAPGRCIVPRLLQGPDSSGPRLAYEVAQGLEPCTAGLVEKLLPLW